MTKTFTIQVDIYATDEEDYDRIVDDIMSVKGVEGECGKQWAAIPDDSEDGLS